MKPPVAYGPEPERLVSAAASVVLVGALTEKGGQPPASTLSGALSGSAPAGLVLARIFENLIQDLLPREARQNLSKICCPGRDLLLSSLRSSPRNHPPITNESAVVDIDGSLMVGSKRDSKIVLFDLSFAMHLVRDSAQFCSVIKLVPP